VKYPVVTEKLMDNDKSRDLLEKYLGPPTAEMRRVFWYLTWFLALTHALFVVLGFAFGSWFVTVIGVAGVIGYGMCLKRIYVFYRANGGWGDQEGGDE
jgi:hypothetical protein